MLFNEVGGGGGGGRGLRGLKIGEKWPTFESNNSN